MERMYIIVADDDIPLSERDKDNFKILCYMLYDTITSYEDYNHIRVLNEEVMFNELKERKTDKGYIHSLAHNFDEALMYEPFMLADNIFGFTVHDGSIDEEKLLGLLESNMPDIPGCRDFKFQIVSKTYEPDKKEKNRQHAIKKVNEEFNRYQEAKVRKRILRKQKDD